MNSSTVNTHKTALWPKYRLPWLLGLLALLLLTSACGFRLRGFIDLPANLQPLYISSQAGAHNFAANLHRQLEQSGIQLSPSLAGSRLHLSLQNFNSGQRQLIFGVREEYELELQIQASATDAQGEPVFDPQVFSARRLYAYDRATDTTLARDALRQELLRSMEDDLLRQITLRIQALSLSAAPNVAPSPVLESQPE